MRRVSATLAVAILGAVTAVAGLLWQVVSFALTGARIDIFAMSSLDEDGHWYVEGTVSNVGRLDASLIGLTLWMDHRGHRLRRLRWRLAAWRRRALRRRRRIPLLVFSPMIHLKAPAMLEVDEVRLELPALLRAGEMLSIPRVGLSRDGEGDADLLRVAVHLGSGQIAVTRPLSLAELEPPLEMKGQQAIRIF
jgi:hypothetical protein